VITNVSPALDLFLLQDWPLTSAEKFVAICQDSDRPVAIVITEVSLKGSSPALAEKVSPIPVAYFIVWHRTT